MSSAFASSPPPASPDTDSPGDVDRRGPDVRVPPPLYFVAALAVGWLGDAAWRPLPIAPDEEFPIELLGGLVITIGVVLAVTGVLTFRAARTGILPHTPATQVVTTGPYRITRNPMYTGMAIVTIGVALLVNSWWPLLSLPVALALLVRFVVRREEAYLRRKFGSAYRAYCARVRRWL
ncbi:MAG: isoprenylcysteine carboxylmethyltransferase family protein [Gemmatimonadaceae bacterium]|nr:isoprenylcysteine carboxylmethyltransferase family protein [Gemmatimonadaceae bacterium]